MQNQTRSVAIAMPFGTAVDRGTAHRVLRNTYALLSMTLLFGVPPLLTAIGAALSFQDLRFLGAAAPGFLAWALMVALYRPAPRFFGLSGFRAWGLPLVGALYGLMTLDSALRGGRKDWR
jgi:modulator of FtsH protease